MAVRLLPGVDRALVPDLVDELTQYGRLPAMRVPDAVLGLIADSAVRHLATAR